MGPKSLDSISEQLLQYKKKIISQNDPCDFSKPNESLPDEQLLKWVFEWSNSHEINFWLADFCEWL